jgi:hypothetical protein
LRELHYTASLVGRANDVDRKSGAEYIARQPMLPVPLTRAA